jgi:methylenetetrahydrofolate reductase (NADPH)
MTITVLNPLKSKSVTYAAAIVQRVTDFLIDFSVEATRPKPADFDAVAAAAPAGTHLYLSAIPTRPSLELVDQAILARKAGLEPVPHIAVRNYTSKAELADLLGRLRDGAAVRRVLIISGDRPDSAGAFTASLEVIESGILQQHGISDIGIAGHPDGHPVVADEVMQRALLAKLNAAEQSGLQADIVTQFGFDALAMVRWIRKLRDLGVDVPVRIGLAGPTNLTTLLKYAQRCGVKASAGGLVKNAGLVKHLFGVSAPDGLVRALADENAAGSLGPVAAHFFSFGGIGATARWAAHAAQGLITPDGDGFSVAP